MSSTTPSPADPPNLSGEASSPNSVCLVAHGAPAVSRGGEEGKGEALGESSLRSALAQAGQIREDQVQNAVNFLLHPKVRGSPEAYTRTFLQRKGLTNKEIDEAYRRVPDPPSSTMPAEEVKLELAKHATISRNSLASLVSVTRPRFSLSQTLLAVGILAASGAGTAMVFKSIVIPWMKTWVKKVVAGDGTKLVTKSKSSLAQDAAEAAKLASSSAALVATACQQLLNAETEERRYFEAFMEKLNTQMEELKSISNVVHNLGKSRRISVSVPKQTKEHMFFKSQNGTTNNAWKSQPIQSNTGFSSLDLKHFEENGTHNAEFRTVRQSSASTAKDPMLAPHSQSYMEIIEMIQRGEKPPNVKEINDMPPDPNQPISKPLLAPRPKPWEINQQSNQRLSQGNTQGLSSEVRHLNHGSSNGLENIFWRKNQTKFTHIEPQVQDLGRSDTVFGTNELQSPKPPEVQAKAADSNGQPQSFVQREVSSEVKELTTLPSDDVEEQSAQESEFWLKPEKATGISSDLCNAEMQEQQVGVEVC